jgi:hypothetical protein
VPAGQKRALAAPRHGTNRAVSTHKQKEARICNPTGTAARALNCRARYSAPLQEAQDTFTEAHDCAVQTYGEGDKADRAAFTALKEKFEKRGDHWITK